MSSEGRLGQIAARAETIKKERAEAEQRQKQKQSEVIEEIADMAEGNRRLEARHRSAPRDQAGKIFETTLKGRRGRRQKAEEKLESVQTQKEQLDKEIAALKEKLRADIETAPAEEKERFEQLLAETEKEGASLATTAQEDEETARKEPGEITEEIRLLQKKYDDMAVEQE